MLPSAKFGSIIRVTKKYADKFCFRALAGLQGRLGDGNLFDFYKKSNKFRSRLAVGGSLGRGVEAWRRG